MTSRPMPLADALLLASRATVSRAARARIDALRATRRGQAPSGEAVRITATRDAQKIAESRLREQGYADGYARRACRSALLVYQESYRMGTIARDAQEEGDDAA